MFLSNIRFFNGGYCLQAEWLSGVNSWRWRRFHAVFIEFQHPVHGRCLIDTGYGPEVIRQWRRWPWCLLGFLTPTPKKQAFTQSDYLSRQRLDPSDIARIFISHFHPDHVGGLSLFPQSRFVYRRYSWDSLKRAPILQQLKNGFIPGLVPDDFESRSDTIDEQSFQSMSFERIDLRCLDYFGDGTLILVDLPGHALGHTGYLLRTAGQTILYVVDAFWDRRALIQNRKLPWIARHVASHPKDYEETLQRLRAIVSDTSWVMLACHCPATQRYVTESPP